MRVALRLFIMLVALPAVLLWFAWELAQLPGLRVGDATGGGPGASTTPAAAAASGQPPSRELLRDLIAQRRARAAQCVSRALRVAGGDLRDARLTLVVATSTGCRSGCEAERIAEQLNDSYTLEGLQVLLLRTDDDGRMDTPMGVSTVALPDCADLFADHGHDYFLRQADGSLSSSGERHEAALVDDIAPGFDPEPLVRRQLNLRH